MASRRCSHVVFSRDVKCSTPEVPAGFPSLARDGPELHQLPDQIRALPRTGKASLDILPAVTAGRNPISPYETSTLRRATPTQSKVARSVTSR